VNHKYLSSLLDYHYWAQDRLFTAVRGLSSEEFTRDMGNSFPSIRDTLTHIYVAESIWYSRWQEASIAVPSAEMFPDLKSLRDDYTRHEVRMRALLEGLGQDGVNQVIDYTSRLDGQTHSSLFWQMFQHVMNHATYHRGQVTTMLRQLGAKPPESLDLIAFYWEQDAGK
jgi:uncharacterized damage-inducible protein DinB